MRLGYKYYRHKFIELTILNVVLIPTGWNYFRGQGNPKDEPAAWALIAILEVVGYLALFIGMRRAKGREQVEKQTR
jgi:hypothetical protein